jgi:hypothetical protein
MSDSNIVRKIDANEVQLNDLFKEVLDGLRDDISEAQNNIEDYKKMVTAAGDGGFEVWGSLLNQALTLKFLNTFKDRVTKKEAVALAQELKKKDDGVVQGIDHAAMNKVLEDLKNSGELENIDLDYE